MNKQPIKTYSYPGTLFNHKCPHCRTGNIFEDDGSYNLKSFMKMNDNCTVCGQRTEIEKGFYYGTGYVSYAISIAFSVSTFVAWWVIIGISVNDDRIFWWLGVNIVLMLILQPYFMRLSRVVWLSFFVKYDRNWKIHKAQMAT
ncbi:MAG: DUF983 domain-containing protein [Rhizobacter sp.]|nr:DUF983 domain-containing protein [Ferruginibacter sp.]